MCFIIFYFVYSGVYNALPLIVSVRNNPVSKCPADGSNVILLNSTSPFTSRLPVNPKAPVISQSPTDTLSSDSVVT